MNDLVPTGWIDIEEKKPPSRKILQFIWNGKVYAGWYDNKIPNFYRFTLRSHPGDDNEFIITGVKFWAYLMKPTTENKND